MVLEYPPLLKLHIHEMGPVVIIAVVWNYRPELELGVFSQRIPPTRGSGWMRRGVVGSSTMRVQDREEQHLRFSLCSGQAVASPKGVNSDWESAKRIVLVMRYGIKLGRIQHYIRPAIW
jgi:hypothetical protein